MKDILKRKYGDFVTKELTEGTSQVFLENINYLGDIEQAEVIRQIKSLKDEFGNRIVPDNFFQNQDVQWGFDFSGWIGKINERKKIVVIGAEPSIKTNYQVVYEFGNKTLPTTSFEYNLIFVWSKKVEQNIKENKELIANPDAAKAALAFSKNVLKENLRVRFHERLPSRYLDVQMIFETDNFVTDHFISYTSYSNQLYQDNSAQSNYEGFLLFVGTYDSTESAEFAFQELKSNSQIRIAELAGFTGLLVEQVQVYEKIRKSGGMITQKDKYVFYLPENCGEPPVGKSWQEFENLFLASITEKNEEIEVLNADCGKDVFLIQSIKASR